jgi:hypothetical protein
MVQKKRKEIGQEWFHPFLLAFEDSIHILYDIRVIKNKRNTIERK